MHPRTEQFFCILCLGSLILTFGCIGPTEKTYQYTLTPITDSPSATQKTKEILPGKILIMPVQLAALLQHPGILSRPDETTVHITHTHTWAVPLDRQLTTVLTQNLRHLLKSPNIFVYPGPKYAQFKYRVEVHMEDFSMTGKSFNTQATWTINDSKTQRVLKYSSFTDTREPTLADYQHQVKAGSKAVEEMSKQIAKAFIDLRPPLLKSD
ncbi:MAG: hypothetical protein CSA33_06075 [Desulfobulbus propionicus]|nr:MAG: hypothetical protein CSA33_06075 [Desulfobulbus propionicus]